VRTSSLEVADIFRARGPSYRLAQAGRLSLAQLKVMSAIQTCRTAALGGHVDGCDDCGYLRVAYNSCRNRHCPKCQAAAARTWLAERKADLLPVGYFHVVFTLPAEPPAQLPPCPCCGGRMRIIETFERWMRPRAPPAATGAPL
jgi:hypothetical protein